MSSQTASPRRRLRTTLAISQLLPWYLFFAVTKHVVPLRMLVKLAWRDPRPVPGAPTEREAVARVIRAVNLLGWTDRDCLQRSLVLYRLLSLIGRDPILMVGLKRSGTGVEGHAWVMTNGRVLGEAPQHVEQFLPFCGFGRYGQCTPANSA